MLSSVELFLAHTTMLNSAQEAMQVPRGLAGHPGASWPQCPPLRTSIEARHNLQVRKAVLCTELNATFCVANLHSEKEVNCQYNAMYGKIRSQKPRNQLSHHSTLPFNSLCMPSNVLPLLTGIGSSSNLLAVWFLSHSTTST